MYLIHKAKKVKKFKNCKIVPFNTSFMKSISTTSYHNSAQSYSSDVFSLMSPRIQFSVLMISYTNKLMDAAWPTHYLQSLLTFSWPN